MTMVVLLFDIGLTNFAQAQSIGPFNFASWRSADLKKPPFKTGARACQMMFSSEDRPQASIAEIKKKWPQMAREIKQNIYNINKEYYRDMTHEQILKRSLLSCSVCRGGSYSLVQALDKANIRLDVTPVITAYRIDAIEAMHIYLKVDNYFGPGEALILDPTIRQFFSKPLADQSLQESQTEINKKIPMIFIGKETELRDLFEKHYKPTAADPDQTWKDVVDLYLVTNVYKNMFAID